MILQSSQFYYDLGANTLSADQSSLGIGESGQHFHIIGRENKSDWGVLLYVQYIGYVKYCIVEDLEDRWVLKTDDATRSSQVGFNNPTMIIYKEKEENENIH
jgi:hypothetical protein